MLALSTDLVVLIISADVDVGVPTNVEIVRLAVALVPVTFIHRTKDFVEEAEHSPAEMLLVMIWIDIDVTNGRFYTVSNLIGIVGAGLIAITDEINRTFSDRESQRASITHRQRALDIVTLEDFLDFRGDPVLEILGNISHVLALRCALYLYNSIDLGAVNHYIPGRPGKDGMVGMVGTDGMLGSDADTVGNAGSEAPTPADTSGGVIHTTM